MKELTLKSLSFNLIGPDLSENRPIVLYFSLSGENSLSLPPYCTPANLLSQKGCTVLSTTLPSHEDNARPREIKELWGGQPEVLLEFFEALTDSIEELGKPLSVVGLSRGVFIGAHLAIRSNLVKSVLGFAPMTYLIGEKSLDLIHYKESIAKKPIRFSIGHNDTLVNRERVSSLVDKMIEASEEEFPDITLMIHPSVGIGGHGTRDQIFEEGVEWLMKRV